MESDEVQNVVGQKYSPQVIDSDRPMSKRETAKDNAMFAPGTPRRKHLAHGYDFLPVGGFIPGVSSNSRHKRPGRSQDGWARREHPIFTTNPVFFEPLRCELLPISWTEKSVTY